MMRCGTALQDSRNATICAFVQMPLDFHPTLAHAMSMSDASEIIAANAAFYAAFGAGDFAALAAIWAEEETISCIHPGWPAIVGRTAVLGSWREILKNAARPQIVCAEPYAIIDGDHGRVICIELVDGAPLAATNYFRRIAGAWRLVHHQSSAIAQFSAGADDTTEHGRSIH